MKISLTEFRIYAVRPGDDRKKLVSPFPEDRWQFALKMVNFLNDAGWQGVELREVSVEIEG